MSITNDHVSTEVAVPARWISVVFLQGDEADAVLDLIERSGTDAGIAHLMEWDYSDETTDAALINGYVYETIPAGMTDRVFEDETGEYLLTYSAAHGHVSLLRRYTAPRVPELNREGQTHPLAPPGNWDRVRRPVTRCADRGVTR